VLLSVHLLFAGHPAGAAPSVPHWLACYYDDCWQSTTQ
jgi:hypothetical protein